MQLSGSNLLVIDDDDQVRQSIVIHLEHCGFEALQASDGREGLRLAVAQSPQLVLCDLSILARERFKLLEQFSKQLPDLPVIAISDDGVMSEVAEALRVGASNFLIRPQEDLEVLEHAVRRALDRAHLRNENQRIRERLELANRELENHLRELRADQTAGRQVQLNMLPASPWVSGSYRFEHRTLPSLYLSGDFVDYFRISDTQLAFYLADVSGHGASSAFVTVLLKFMTTRLLYEQRKLQGQGAVMVQPSDVLQHLNRGLISCNLGKHVTMLGGVIDESAQTLTYSIGGHLPLPVLCVEGQAYYLEGKGRPVGLFTDAKYENQQIPLPAEFSLTLCSDGVLDCIDGATLKEKEDRLPIILGQANGDLDSFMQLLGLAQPRAMPDDISVLMLSRKPQ